MTIEQKAKRYDEALGRAKGLYAKGAPDSLYLEEIFPELKESEDERIRKNLIELFHDTVSNDEIFSDYGLDKTEVLAWLEKQGEQKPTLEDAAKAFLEALSETPYNNTPIVEAQIITKQLLIFLSAPKSYNPDAINEQKPNDNVEPKFKVGDWITIKE